MGITKSRYSSVSPQPIKAKKNPLANVTIEVKPKDVKDVCKPGQEFNVANRDDTTVKPVYRQNPNLDTPTRCA